MIKDFYGKELLVGDIIIYVSVKHAKSSKFSYGVYHSDFNNGSGHKLRVKLYKTDWYGKKIIGTDNAMIFDGRAAGVIKIINPESSDLSEIISSVKIRDELVTSKKLVIQTNDKERADESLIANRASTIPSSSDRILDSLGIPGSLK